MESPIKAAARKLACRLRDKKEQVLLFMQDLDDEEARPGCDGDHQEVVHRCADPACPPLLETIRAATNPNKMSV